MRPSQRTRSGGSSGGGLARKRIATAATTVVAAILAWTQPKPAATVSTSPAAYRAALTTARVMADGRVDSEGGDPHRVGGGEDAVSDNGAVGGDGVDDGALRLGDVLECARREERTDLDLGGGDELAVGEDGVVGRHRDGAGGRVEGEHLGDRVDGLVLDGDDGRGALAAEDEVTDGEVGHEDVLALGGGRREEARRRRALGKAAGRVSFGLASGGGLSFGIVGVVGVVVAVGCSSSGQVGCGPQILANIRLLEHGLVGGDALPEGR